MREKEMDARASLSNGWGSVVGERWIFLQKTIAYEISWKVHCRGKETLLFSEC